MTDYTELEQTLKLRLDELTDRADELEEDLRQPIDSDWDDQAVDLADDEAQAGVESVLRQEIAQIRAALGRLADGTYGSCSVCGADIGIGRLNARPIATRCIDHAV